MKFFKCFEYNFRSVEDIQEELGFKERLTYWTLSFLNYDSGDSYPSILKPIENPFEVNTIYVIPLSDSSLKVFISDIRHYRRQKIEHLFCLIEKFMKEITKNPDVKVNLLTQNNE